MDKRQMRACLFASIITVGIVVMVLVYKMHNSELLTYEHPQLGEPR